MNLLRFFLPGFLVLLSLAPPGAQSAETRFTYHPSGELLTATSSGVSAPSIYRQPQAVQGEVGQIVVLSVGANGTAPLAYAWYKDSGTEPVGTGPALVFSPFAATDAGNYRVTVTNGQGPATSQTVAVTVAVVSDPLADALGTPGQTWRRGGTSFWKTVTTPGATHDGSSAVTSGLSVFDTSYVETDIVGPKTLSFWVKLTGAGGSSYDSWGSKFSLVVNGLPIRRYANFQSGYGETQLPADTWQQLTFDLPPGTWTVRWERYDTFYGSSGTSISLDDVVLTTPVDTDNDGLSDDWERRFFSGSIAPEPDGNPDLDSSDNLTEYQDISLPQEGSASVMGALNYHLYTAVQGSGSITLSPVQGPLGYATSTPPSAQQFNPRNMEIQVTAVPGPGQVFAAWIDREHNTDYTANPLPGVKFDGQPVPYDRNQFNTMKSRKLTAVFSPEITLAEALDTPGRVWTTGGNAPFIGQNFYTDDGVDGARSGAATGGPQVTDSWIETQITGPAKVSWRQLQKGFTGYYSVQMDDFISDSLTSYYDLGGWKDGSIYVPTGTHTVRWNVRDYGNNAARSAFAFDQMVITPAVDSDNDGLGDDWEQANFGNLDRDGTLDSDNDGATDREEYDRLTIIGMPVRRMPFTVTATTGGTATLSPTRSAYLMGYTYYGGEAENLGEIVTIDAVPAANYRFDEWQDGRGEPLTLANYVRVAAQHNLNLSYPPAGLTLKAVFSPLLGEGLDMPSLTFHNSNRLWRTRTSTTRDGIDSVETAALRDEQTADMYAVINGPVVISFWWKSSGEAGKLTTFCFAGNENRIISGETDWRREFIVVPAGSHNLGWTTYCNDSNRGANKAFVDQLKIEADTDQNGLGDDWEILHFGARGADPDDDFDNDGVKNRDEYADNTNPKQSSSAAYRLTLITPEPGATNMTPLHGPHPPGTPITLTADAALTGWTGDVTSSANPLVVTLDRNKTVTAVFNPLALAADNTKLIWTTGGAQPWNAEIPSTSISSPNYDINYSAGPALAEGQQSWIQTTVTGPSIVRFNAGLMSGYTPAYNAYYSRHFWSVDGVEKGAITFDWIYGSDETVYIPAGTHTVRWTFEKGVGENYSTSGNTPLGAYLDNVRVEPQPAAPVALADAVDNTGLTFTTSGTSPWLGGNVVSKVGSDAAFAWGTPRGGQSVLETTVPGPGTVSFWWKVVSNYNEHMLRFLVDGQAAVPAVSGDTGWVKVTYVVRGGGAHTLRWVYDKNNDPSVEGDGAWVDQVAFVAAPFISLADAADTTGMTWTTGGDATWTGINTVTHDGTDAVESGPIGDSQETWVQTTVTGPGTLDFWWKISSKFTDIMIVYMDGARYFADDYIQGEIDWRQASLDVPTGTHTIKWRYFKSADSSSSVRPASQDRAWLDQVTFSPISGAPEISIEQPEGTVIADRGISAFGTVALNSTTIKTFTIKNVGTRKLKDIYAAMLDWEQTDFEILDEPIPATSLMPGESTTFQVKFNPTTLGTKGAWIAVVSDDSDETVHEIRLTGTAAPPPEIAIEQPAGANLVDGVSGVNFGTVNTGSFASLLFTVKNSGAGNLAGLTVTRHGDHPGDFSVTGPAATVASNKSSTFTVKFSPTGGGLRQAVLHVVSNDADESPFEIQVTGNGVAAKPVFSQAPQPQLVGTGQSAAFSTTAVGSGVLTYKWLKNGAAAPGSTNATAYTIASAALANAGNYSASATSALGTGTSAAAPLTVVSLAPTNVTVNEGTTLTLKAVLAAPAGVPLTYLWKKAGASLVNGGVAPAQVISGATSGTLSITKASSAETAAYTCVIGMGALSKESGAFNVTVRLKPVVDSVGPLAWSVSESVTTQFTAENSPVSFAFTNLPAGVTGNTTTGKLSGKPNTPTTATSKPFTVVASNAAGKSASVAVSYTVTALPAAAIGTFNGLVDRNTVLSAPLAVPAGRKLQGHGGRLSNLAITATGLFTATLQMEEKSYAMPAKSRLDAAVGTNPAAHVVIPRGTGIAALILDFTINKDSGELTGTVSDGSSATPASVRAWRQTAPPVVQVGNYTAVLQLDPAFVGTDGTTSPPGNAANITYPQGYGFLTLKLDNKGAATWGGKLADGTAITGASSIGPTGGLPFFQLLYGNVAATTGSATGWVTVAPDSATPQNGGKPLLDGLIGWNKNPQLPTSTTRSYKAGFPLHNLTVVGGLYSAPPANTIIFGLPDVNLPAVNARLTFSEGGLAGPSPIVAAVMASDLARDWRISKTHIATLPVGVANPAAVTLKLVPSAGTFNGAFTLKNDPDATKPPATLPRAVLWYGILVPRLNGGYGQFQLPQLPVVGPPKTTLTTSPQYSGGVVLEGLTGQ